jgi:hypothetical protein
MVRTLKNPRSATSSQRASPIPGGEGVVWQAKKNKTENNIPNLKKSGRSFI